MIPLLLVLALPLPPTIQVCDLWIVDGEWEDRTLTVTQDNITVCGWLSNP